MTDEELTRRLATVRHTPRADRASRRSLTLSTIARETGITREMLHMIATGKRQIGTKTRTALREYFACEQSSGVKSSVPSTTETEHGHTISVRFGLGWRH
jgi:hypothetical protein